MSQISPGTVLENGALVVAHDKCYVVAIRIGSPNPYCVWSIDESLNAFNGSYFASIYDAVDYLHNKVRNYGS